jgi:hypothetical protein
VEFPEQGVISLLLAGSPGSIASLQAGAGLQALQAALVGVAQAAAAGVDPRGGGVSVLLNATATWYQLLLPVALTTSAGSAWSPAAQNIALGALAAQVGIPPTAASLLQVVVMPPPPLPPPPLPPPSNASTSVSAAPAGRRRTALSLPSATGCATAAGGGVTFTAMLGPVGQGLAGANASAARVANLPGGALQMLFQGAGLPVTCASAAPQVVANVTFLLALPAVLGASPAAPLSRLTAVTTALQLLSVNGSDLGAAVAPGAASLGLSPLGMVLSGVTVFAPPPLLSPPPSPPNPPEPPSPPPQPSPPDGPPGPPPAPAATFAAQLKDGQDGALTQVILGVIIGSAVFFVIIITVFAVVCTRVRRVMKANAEAREKEERRLAAIVAAEEAREQAIAAMYGAKPVVKAGGRIPQTEMMAPPSGRPSRKASQRSSQIESESETEEEAAERRRRRRERRRAREGSEASYV